MTASDPVTFDILGWAVASTDSTVLVGKPGDSSSESPGAVYVYEKPTSWTNMTQTAKLTASDGFPRGGFGWSVAISGDTVVVGAIPNNGPANKKVYVFVKPKSGWANMTETAQLTVSGLSTSTLGNSVGISGDTIVASGYSADFVHSAVHVFVKPAGGWANMHQTATLTDGATFDSLGWSLAIDGDTVVAGAPVYENSFGAAYVFVRPLPGWKTTSHANARLTATGLVANAYLGYSVSVYQDTIVAGAAGATPAGAAFVYVRPSSGWANMTPTAKLVSGSLGSACFGDNFGGAVHISRDVVVVGASLTTIGDPCSVNSLQFVGAVYLYVKPVSGWKSTSLFLTELFASDMQQDGQLGWSVANQGTTIITGAFNVDGNQGAAYVFVPHE